MNRKELKVGDEIAIGRQRGAYNRMMRGMVTDLRSWIRVYDRELGKAIDIPVSYTHLTLPTIYSV